MSGLHNFIYRVFGQLRKRSHKLLDPIIGLEYSKFHQRVKPSAYVPSYERYLRRWFQGLEAGDSGTLGSSGSIFPSFWSIAMPNLYPKFADEVPYSEDVSSDLS